ncbi:MAG: DUF1349 domain-containing protein [Culicoidibacterales bacterium]
MAFNLQAGEWIFAPQQATVTPTTVTIVTEPGTDFWQRTYYGFQNDNAPALLFQTEDDFSFTVKTRFQTKMQYDQCGLIIYQDSENWCKASSEYETKAFQRLGSVVTNYGYSDWATSDIPAEIQEIWYRLSRRGQDFQFEYSLDGVKYQQMRIFHLFNAASEIRFGVYACSPSESSFVAEFSDFDFGPCLWEKHE